MKKLRGQFTLLVNPTETIVEFRDADAHKVILKATIPAEEFQKALGRLVMIPCDVDYYDENNEVIGMKREQKEVVIPYHPNGKARFDHETWENVQKSISKTCGKEWKLVQANKREKSKGKNEDPEIVEFACTIERWV